MSRGDWLWKAANIKNVNSSAVGYVGSSRHSTILCFSALKLWRNNFMRCFSWSLRSKWLRIVLVNIVEHLQLSTKIYNRGRASYPFHSINYACNYWSMESLLWTITMPCWRSVCMPHRESDVQNEWKGKKSTIAIYPTHWVD